MDRILLQKTKTVGTREVIELKKRQDNVEYHLRKNPSVSYNKIPNMTDALRKVQT